MMLTLPGQQSLFDARTPKANSRFAERDICENRHGGDPESVAAHAAGDKQRDRELVFAFIRSRGTVGATSDEFAQYMNRPLNAVSGRFTELKADGRIVSTGETRPTRSGSPAKVYVLTPPPGTHAHLVGARVESHRAAAPDNGD